MTKSDGKQFASVGLDLNFPAWMAEIAAFGVPCLNLAMWELNCFGPQLCGRIHKQGILKVLRYLLLSIKQLMHAEVVLITQGITMESRLLRLTFSATSFPLPKGPTSQGSIRSECISLPPSLPCLAQQRHSGVARKTRSCEA